MKGVKGMKASSPPFIPSIPFIPFIPFTPFTPDESSKCFLLIVLCGIATLGSIERTNLDLDVGRPSRLSDPGR